MNIPRFTLLQLLGAMTVCGALFCIAAIDPQGAAVAVLVFFACLLTALFANMLTYLVTRIVSAVTSFAFGGGNEDPRLASSPFPDLREASPFRPQAPDLAATVESLQAKSERQSRTRFIKPDDPETR